jgi:hypothetical protein
VTRLHVIACTAPITSARACGNDAAADAVEGPHFNRHRVEPPRGFGCD